VEDIIGYMARTSGAALAALGPENPNQGELLRQLFATGKAKVAK
jgi:hypothetical protein